MITVIVRWDDMQIPTDVEWQLWRQLRGAMGIDRFIFVPRIPQMIHLGYDHVDTMEEALLLADDPKVFLEHSGAKGMNDIPDGDVTIIAGNTPTGNESYALPDEIYSIKQVGSGGIMYAINAVAIALAYRLGQ